MSWLNGRCSARTPDAVLAMISLLCIPGWLMKQIINVHQLMASVDMIVALDSKVP